MAPSDRILLEPLSASCRAWLTNLLCRALPRAGGIVLRSNGQLLLHPGFDIDILVPEAALADLIRDVEPDGAGPLLLLERRGPAGVKLAVFDLSATSDTGRAWLLIDVQTVLRLGQHRLAPTDIATAARQEDGATYPVPDAAWQSLLDVVQDYRKSRPPHDEPAALVRFTTHHHAMAGRLGLLSGDNTGGLGRLLGIASYREAAATQQTWRNRLSRRMLRDLFFIHHHDVALVCVSGPDGVGKSTLVGNILQKLSQYPLQTAAFHHTRLVKERMATQSQRRRSLTWRLLRLVVPESLRQPFRTLLGEYGYARNLNREIADQHLAGQLTLTDRYAYDRCLKMRLHRKSLLQRILAWATVLLMRRPRLLIVPVDTPPAIHARKTELSERQIAWYYDQMRRIVRWRRIETLWLTLPNTPQNLAMQATRAILLALGDDLFAMIGRYEKRRATRP